MKIRCPRCQKKLNIPDKYAGKAIRCPACHRAFRVPKPVAGVGGADAPTELDLEGLAQLEAGSAEMGANELADAQADIDAKKLAQEKDEKNVRRCPKCNARTKIEDPQIEVLCSNCWTPIPALVKEGAKSAKRKAGQGTGAGGFYAELGTAITYPIPALGSLGTAVGVAILAGLIPVIVVTAMSNLMEQGAVGTVEGVKAADLSGVALLLVGIFGLEVVFFSAVALHAFLDVVRTTCVDNDRPPNLTWSPSEWGKSLVAYLVLAIYYVLATYVVTLLTIDDGVLSYLTSGNVKEIPVVGGTGFIVGMVVVSIGIPMNLIGIAIGSSLVEGLNPVNVIKSMSRTHVHYVFLVLILSVYAILIGGAFTAILFDWFIPQLDTMYKSSAEGDIMQVGLALLAWGLVMGLFFFGAYVLARLHGLFARTFRKELFFGMH